MRAAMLSFFRVFLVLATSTTDTCRFLHPPSQNSDVDEHRCTTFSDGDTCGPNRFQTHTTVVGARRTYRYSIQMRYGVR